MTTIELRGALTVLAEVEDLLSTYDQDIWNGHSCPTCRAYGGGTAVPHLPTCGGVQSLRDLRKLKQLMKRDLEESHDQED